MVGSTVPCSVLLDVEEAEAALAHDPLVGAGGGEVDAERLDVHRHRADGLDDVGEDQGAAGVGQGADGLAVVHEAVDVRDQRQRHQPGVAVDGLVHVGQVDRPVAVLDDAQLDALLLELLVHVEGGREVQLVDDDVALLLRQVHAHHDDVLAVGGAGGEGDLARAGADQRAEALLQVGLAVVVEIGAAGAGAVQPERHALLDRLGGEAAERMHRARVQIGLERGGREVLAHRRREHSAGVRRGSRLGEAGEGRTCRPRCRARTRTRQELPTTDRCHVGLLDGAVAGPSSSTRRGADDRTGMRDTHSPMSDPCGWPVHRLAAAVAAGEISAVEVVQAHLTRIAAVDPRLGAFVDVDADGALAAARSQDEGAARGEPRGALGGVPVTVKSAIDVAGLRCETGSPTRAGMRSDADAVVVARLRAAGAFVLGTTNVAEMLMGYETVNPLHGRTRNPWDLDRTPGGSSGGESAAIAAGCSAGGIGSDGGGSIRVPAHFTGICGLKPTPGRVPSTGHQPACIGPFSIIGVVGPMARTVAEVEALYRVLAGWDDFDPFATPLEVEASLPDRDGWRVGWFDGTPGCASHGRNRGRRSASGGGVWRRRAWRVEPCRPAVLDRAAAALADVLLRDGRACCCAPRSGAMPASCRSFGRYAERARWTDAARCVAASPSPGSNATWPVRSC